MMRSRLLVPARRAERGFSLAELLVVIAIIGIFCLIAIPAVGNFIRAGKVRAGNDLLMGDLRAVRYIAITNHVSGSLTIDSTAGTWSYSDIHGGTVTRTLDPGVRITTGNATITFGSDGTTTSGATTVVLQGNVIPSVDHQYTISITTVGRLTSAFAKV
jgi:prepilin-type N-terminal cleavage/methylation domain-containing protein